MDSIQNPIARKWIRLWLIGLGVLVYTMILVGGATRLTDSGLSITDWRPLAGALPPMSDTRWNELFDMYRETAEYRLQNAGMSMAEFQYIYWWEWAHRFFGRFIGLFAIIGMIVFWARGWLNRPMTFRFSLLIALGGLQGVIGMWMVASGIGETTRVDVAPYRLMTHLCLALFIIALICWFWLDLGKRALANLPISILWPVALLVLISLQMASGALVAGHDAGRTYTDWPLMAGEFVPTGYWGVDLGPRNIVENAATAQFNHRMLAYAIVALTLLCGLLNKGKLKSSGFGWLAAGVISQTVWGIVTLMSAAPLNLALVHQGLGVVVLLTSVHFLWRVSRSHQ